ncbi:hypothetical protein BKA59DRAFT_461481 [Fusarium tricinctum]|uniref:Uncharacterized protein n=1 Tax=Fusarium tricinctum TaxID=61284 RepID=A0A8K0RK24_9HYPO|nr:hypothetical protein BKA59DRAFT_461481 [Fusarium tricinctum]
MAKYALVFVLRLLAQVHSGITALIPRVRPDYGQCSEPTVMYVEDQDGMLGFGYKPTNHNDFPHGAGANIQASTDLICSNLQNVCRAPVETVKLCQTAAAAAKSKVGQDAAHTFNIAITASSSHTSASDTGTPSEDSADAQDLVEPTLNMKFSTEFVTMEGHIDPVWWFNEYILADGQPALCDETPRRMPNDHYITFTCEGADPRIVPMMRDALNDFVQSTMYNEESEDRPFKQHYKNCGEYLTCDPYEKRTRFPQSVHIATALDIPGAGGALSGSLRYTISESTDDNCGLCGFLSAGGTLASAVAAISGTVLSTSALISPGISGASASISFSCLSTCK